MWGEHTHTAEWAFVFSIDFTDLFTESWLLWLILCIVFNASQKKRFNNSNNIKRIVKYQNHDCDWTTNKRKTKNLPFVQSNTTKELHERWERAKKKNHVRIYLVCACVFHILLSSSLKRSDPLDMEYIIMLRASFTYTYTGSRLRARWWISKTWKYY